VSLAFVITAVTLGTDAGAAIPSRKSEHSRVFSPTVPAKGDGVSEKSRPRLAGAQSPLLVAWLAGLGLVLTTHAAVGQEAGSGAGDARPASSLAGSAEIKTSRDRLGRRQGRRRQRTAVTPRLAGWQRLAEKSRQ